MVGDAFMQGPRYRLPLPKVCRPFGAYNSHNLIPNSRSHITCLIVPLAFFACVDNALVRECFGEAREHR